MALTSGTRLAEYEILAPIGAGGMGEVYRARDTKLGRDVAIEILPDAFSRDKEMSNRFAGPSPNSLLTIIKSAIIKGWTTL